MIKAYPQDERVVEKGIYEIFSVVKETNDTWGRINSVFGDNDENGLILRNLANSFRNEER
ncbi:MAG: hypothetical protein LBQ03_02355 [Puniceicoccales bacterium]|jgi:hypothetical protein|nr:hypothetical protein [Puniceicoccales bacterium]